MQEVYAFGRLALVFAFFTGELNGYAREHGKTSGWVAHAHEAGVEVDLRSERGYSYEGGIPHDHQRGHGFVEKSLFDVRRLLQYQDVPSRAFCRAYLQSE